MRYRTEDLLTLRDSEPMDAAVRERMLRDPEAQRDLAALSARRHALAALPACSPGPEVDRQVLAMMRDAARNGRQRRGRRQFLLAAALSLPLAVAAILWRMPEPAPPAAPAVAASIPAAEPPRLVRYEEQDYRTLRARSAELEQMLVSLPAQRAVISTVTAGTIVDLEDRIAAIDGSLNQAEASGALPHDRAAIWRERVDLMNALVQVRYAQSRVFPY
jgi:hypothetical protein